MAGELKLLSENINIHEILESIKAIEEKYGLLGFNTFDSVKRQIKGNRKMELHLKHLEMAQELEVTINDLKQKGESINNSNSSYSGIQQKIQKFEKSLDKFVRERGLCYDKYGKVISKRLPKGTY
jgi:hypothetical protein